MFRLDGKVALEGNINFDILNYNENKRTLESKKMELPFAQVVKIQNLQNGMNTEINMNINNIEYTINELIKCKQAYEIYFLKNKLTTLNSIVYKIKKYDTSLDSLIRKYKKSRSLEEYNEITNILD
mgnify:CR=1 FL=1